MNSYAASCCTCFPKVLCGSATSASWPTASVPPACRSAFSCSLPPNNRKPDKALPSIRTHAILGLAPSVVARWCSSSGLRLPKSNFALHPRSRLQHETTPANPKTPCASARSVSPWLAAEHTLSSRSTNCTLRRTVSTQSSFNRTRLSVALRGTASTHPHTRSFPLLNPHKARVRRNHGRLPSSRCIESAQSHRARGRILPTRASDTALRLSRTWLSRCGHFLGVSLQVLTTLPEGAMLEWVPTFRKARSLESPWIWPCFNLLKKFTLSLRSCQLLGTSEPEAPERRFQHAAISHCPAYERSRPRALKWSGSSATERARHTGQSRRQQAYGDLANAGAASPGPRYP